MIKITLITPTRNRIKDLRNLLESIRETAENPSCVEILFYVDDDDQSTLPFIRGFEDEYACLNIRFHVGPRSDHFSKDYYNFLAKQAAGRWVMAINDDSLFTTPGWDTIICDKMQRAADIAGDDILLGIVNDGMERSGQEKIRPVMSCWLLSSKEYVNLMEGLLIEEIYTWGGDYWLGRLFCKIRSGSRKVYILNVFIDHISHHTNARRGPDQQLPQPESFAHFQRIESENPCTFNEQCLREKLEKINQYLSRIK